MSFEAESNSELTVIISAYQLHFRFPVQNKIRKQKFCRTPGPAYLAVLPVLVIFCPFGPTNFKKSVLCTPRKTPKAKQKIYPPPPQFSVSTYPKLLLLFLDKYCLKSDSCPVSLGKNKKNNIKICLPTRYFIFSTKVERQVFFLFLT